MPLAVVYMYPVVPFGWEQALAYPVTRAYFFFSFDAMMNCG
jgi:hypothetical protein